MNQKKAVEQSMVEITRLVIRTKAILDEIEKEKALTKSQKQKLMSWVKTLEPERIAGLTKQEILNQL